MKAQKAFSLTLAVVLAVSLCSMLTGCDQRTGPGSTLIVVLDCSASTTALRPVLDRCMTRLLGSLDPSTKIVLVRMTNVSVKVIECPEVPSPRQLAGIGVGKELAVQPVQGTRPLTALNYAAEYAACHPGEQVSVAMLTDGENSYLGDDIRGACDTLSRVSNIGSIGLFGVATGCNAEWESCLRPFGAKATVQGLGSYTYISGFAQLVTSAERG